MAFVPLRPALPTSLLLLGAAAAVVGCDDEPAPEPEAAGEGEEEAPPVAECGEASAACAGEGEAEPEPEPIGEGEGEGDADPGEEVGEGGGEVGVGGSGCDVHDDCPGGDCVDRVGRPAQCEERRPRLCGADDGCADPPAGLCDRMLGECVRPPEGGGLEVEEDPCVDDDGCRTGRACVDGGCRPAGCDGDRFEDDDSPGRAALLTARRYPALLLCGDETDDWFRVEVPASRGLRAVARPQTPGSELDLALYEVGGGGPVLGLAASGGPAAPWVVRAPTSEAAPVYLRVVGLTAATVTYELTIELPEGGPCVNDEADRAPGNDGLRDLPPRGSRLVLCPDDVDDYAFDAAQGAAIRVTLSRTGDRGELEAELRGPDGAVAGQGGPTPGGWRTEAETDQPGAWTVSVKGTTPPAGLSYTLDVRVLEGAERRLCEDAVELAEGMVAGELGGDPVGPGLSCASDPGPASAWRLVLDAPRRVLLAPTGGDVALRWDCALAETELACAKTGDVLDVGALPAGEYGVVLQGPAEGGPFELDLRTEEPAPPPAHDLCAGAAELTADIAFGGDTWSATDTAVALACGAQPGGADVFHRLELAEEALVSVTLVGGGGGGGGGVHVEARSGCEAGGPALPVCLAGPSLGAGPAVLEAGSWILVIDGVDEQARGDYQLTVHTEAAPPPPANSQCDQAELLLPGQAVVGDTRRGGDLRDPATCGLAPTGRELAYRLPDLPVARLTVEAAFDAVIYGRQGCGDNADEPLCRAAGRQATLRIEHPGEELVLFVDGAAPGQGGEFKLTLEAPPAGDDDVCEGPARAMPLQVGGSTAGAGRDKDPGPGCAGAFPLPGPDLGYALFLAAGDTLHAQLAPVGWDGALYLIDACADADGACLAGADAALSGGLESLTWAAPADQRVLLVVDSFGGGGDFRLDASVADPDL